ncbi:Ankyrin repeat domain-containing protein 13D [Orchesella cincta]|uniref:Ankyrin repeat domain-containing protein 13D n=1 Tax=Orchesella cincta TaxID=48709 RepID=A0A1D2MGY9_ORCCI|nr:Ankyrin repeat domain-containing protein 13D [Orchesella cincta]
MQEKFTMVVSKDKISSSFPLHWLVWEDRHEELEAKLSTAEPKPEELEKQDPRGRTPLLLAVVLGRTECASALLKHGADAQFEHTSNWTVVHEAVCRGDPELLKTVLEYRDVQKQTQKSDLVPNLLKRLKDAPDFYVEMRWEFTSWVPLLTRICPVNTHKVYKMGSNVRVDSTAIGTEEGARADGVSVIFQGQDDCVKMMEIDHATKQVYTNIFLSGNDKHKSPQDSRLYEKTVSYRLSNPAMISFVNLEKIAFERNKTGIWGWGSDKSEKVNGFDCKVFSATNVELVTKIRHEHLSESDKNRTESMSNFHRILTTFGATETSDPDGTGTSKQGIDTQNLAEITVEEYFDPEVPLSGRDIGRPKEARTKVNKFKATVWLCENYPLNLQEQVMPIVDIMALSSSQFNKLKDFIQMQIPAGFPVKIEIPMFHLLNACITFHNIFGTEEPVRGVQSLHEESGRLACVLDEDLFEPPPLYDIRMSVTPAPISSSDDDIFRWTLDDDLSGEAN